MFLNVPYFILSTVEDAFDEVYMINHSRMEKELTTNPLSRPFVLTCGGLQCTER